MTVSPSPFLNVNKIVLKEKDAIPFIDEQLHFKIFVRILNSHFEALS